MRDAVQRAEPAGALSLATDLATGQPAAALLHSSGCTADAYEAALLYGDDIARGARRRDRHPGMTEY
ncbi:MAG TPA: hypothetical protein VGJ32_16980 [Solirubrobacteraceae bacterium]